MYDNDHEIEPNTPVITPKTLTDYQGVWIDVKNDTLFISISSTGIVTYYGGNGKIGQGMGVLQDNCITILNEYTGKTDKIWITTNDGNINSARGEIGGKTNSKEYYYATWSLKQSQEPVVTTFSGDVWANGWNSTNPHFPDGLTQTRYVFTGNNTCIIFYHNNRHGDYMGDTLFYIPRIFNGKKLAIYHYSNSITDKTYILWGDDLRL